jgi:hypothetical protein
MSRDRRGEERLRELMREVPVPGTEEAGRRALRMAQAAFAERRRTRRAPLPRLALAVAIATLLAALLLSPAGAAVRDWVDDVFTAGVPDAEPGLTEIPGGGRLLVGSRAGPWVVQPDGSRRLLGDYREATWSPRGLFVGVVSGRALSAVEPDGTPRWSLTGSGPVADARWSPGGFEIAYRTGEALRVVGADGEDDRLLDRSVDPVAPAWAPKRLPLIAYVDAGGGLRIANAFGAGSVAKAPALAGIAGLEWAADGSRLLESSPAAVRLRELTANKLLARMRIGPPHRLAVPPGSRLRDAALSPDGSSVAVLLVRGPASAPRSEVVLVDTGGGRPRLLLGTPGRLAELAWSPGGDRLLISWPDADQWLFVPADGTGRVRAVGDVAAQFAPGGRAPAFPRIDGWCCRPSIP